MSKINETTKTEYNEFLDDFLYQYNPKAWNSPSKALCLFDISIEYLFPDEVDDDEDELGKIFDVKYLTWIKKV